MPPFGFCGPTYRSQSLSADCQTCMNFYLELIESGDGNSRAALYPTPGLKQFASLLAPFSLNGWFDSATTNTGNSTSATDTITPRATQEAVFAMVSAHGGGSPNPGAGWTFLKGVGTTGSLYVKMVTDLSPINLVEAVGSGKWAAGLALLGASALPTIRQQVTIESGGVGDGNVFAASLPGAVVVGNGILVVTFFDATTNPCSITVTDSLGNAYSPIMTDTAAGATGAGIAMWLVPGTLAGTPNISVTFHTGGGVVGATTYALEMQNMISIAGLAGGITRGGITINGRTFAACGGGLFEIFADGSSAFRGSIANDNSMCSFASSPQQLLVASAGSVYVLDLVTNLLTQINPATFAGPILQVGFTDGFFLALVKETQRFYVSAPYNANDWTTNGSALVSVFQDNIVAMLVDHREVWFWSATKAAVYYDSGAIFPFDVIPSGFIEAGCGASFTPVRLDNTILWQGADERGEGIFWRAQGYTPSRVSNHSVEFEVQRYIKKSGKISDAVAFPYQDQGHNFWVLYFPTADKTWVYDVNTNSWHERGFWKANIGQFGAARYWWHTYNRAFGKHLVGDWMTNKVYELHIPIENATLSGWDFATDFENPIRRVRRAPHIAREQKWIFYKEIQIFLEAGLGIQGNDPTPGVTPQVTLRWSNDGAKTFTPELSAGAGKAGENTVRVRFTRLGRARDRVFEMAVSDPIPWRIVDAYIDADPGDGS